MYAFSQCSVQAGDSQSFTLAAGAYLVGFDPVNMNYPGTVLLKLASDSSTVLTVSVNPFINKVLLVPPGGQTYKFNVSTATAFVWVAPARTDNSV